MLPLQASYERGYETAAQEFAYMHEGFLQRQHLFNRNVSGLTLDEVQAKFPEARQLGRGATEADILSVSRQLGIEAAAVEIPLFVSSEATAAEIPLVSSEATAAEIPLVSSEATEADIQLFFSSEATAHLPFTIGGVVA